MKSSKWRLIIALFVIGLSMCLISCSCPSCTKKKVTPPSAQTEIQPTAKPTKPEEKAPSAVKTEKAEKPAVSLEELKAKEEAEKKKKLEEEINEIESTMIHFDFDKADLKPEAREILKKLAEWLLNHPEFNIRIEGYCDERGTEEYNLALGQRRADAAKRYLIELGVDPDRITTISYGEENPIDPRHCEEAWAKNRRDEFKLIRRK